MALTTQLRRRIKELEAAVNNIEQTPHVVRIAELEASVRTYEDLLVDRDTKLTQAIARADAAESALEEANGRIEVLERLDVMVGPVVEALSSDPVVGNTVMETPDSVIPGEMPTTEEE